MSTEAALRAIADDLGPEGAMALDGVLYAPTREERARSAEQLAALIRPPEVPPLPQPDPAVGRFNTAAFCVSALIGLRQLASELEDSQLDGLLGQSHGRALGLTLAARAAIRGRR
jgi:hypothetical protein